jgi:glycosyltransferase involved in cell wall biosynthesis
MFNRIKYQLKRRLINLSINGNVVAFNTYKTVLILTRFLKKNRPIKHIQSGNYRDSPTMCNTEFEFTPLISIILPVYNPKVAFLEEAIQSVLNQQYRNWELCISDDCSFSKEIRDLIESFALKDTRIKFFFRKKNGHISANSNSALTLATGDYVGLLDHDDVLPSHCLARVVEEINKYPKLDWLYTDEDKIDEKGNRMLPHRKPSWSPDTLLSRNYITHFVVIKKELVEKVGGFRLGVEGSQDHDLLLRIAEHSKEIIHIPEILYHWRSHENSVAGNLGAKSYAIKATKKALEDALKRRGERATVRPYPNLSLIYHIDYLSSPAVKTVLIRYKFGQNNVVKKGKEEGFESITIEASSDSNLLKQLNEVSIKSEADVLCFANSALNLPVSDLLQKLSNQTNRSKTGLLTIPIYLMNGQIHSYGNFLQDKEVKPLFFGSFANKGDNHDYFSSTVNVDYVNPLFFMIKQVDFKNSKGFDVSKTLSGALITLSSTMNNEHHVLSNAVTATSKDSVRDVVRLHKTSKNKSFYKSIFNKSVID